MSGSTDETPTEEAAAELVAEACRILGRLELTHYSFGHVSYRLDERTMLIKGKGPDESGLRYTEVDDIIKVDFDANVVSGRPGLRAPSESFLHIWLYKGKPATRSVVHVHPETAVLLTMCDKPIRPFYGSYGLGVQMAIAGVPVYPRSCRIENDELGAELADFMGDGDHTLLRGHGVAVRGTGVEDAVVRTLQLNELTTMTYKAYLLGEPRVISDEDIAAYSTPLDESRPRGSAGGRSGVLATYRYYRRLAEEK
ncbi:MAG TPA: class II aldolase/adducin family protein [Pseudonocardia sp.]|jgi:L-fuculose-phosphate aldolase|uniref:class II aldolase/adducin family protein n=1 Tax=Pseudonocardia sp. TaxID=60912 RepID=UPI002B4B2EE4|nr:class II aldolase/adducin family protein [Pseudonocardia sp.]HLU56133.1 class II aldolase/adducin family protein [Pseudonocardia sp.]